MCRCSMQLLHKHRWLVVIAVTVIAGGTLHAQPDSTARYIDTSAQRQWLIPHFGGYARSPLGFALEVGARGGIDILRNVVTLTGELGFVTMSVSEDARGGIVGVHALRLEVTPLPIGFMRRVVLHGERRFFDHSLLHMRDYGFGMMYRCGDFPTTKPVLFFDATFVVLKDKFVPVPFIGASIMAWM